MGLNELLYKRVLISDKEADFNLSGKIVKEIQILEISPSGNFVKILNENGTRNWLHCNEFCLVEVLSNKETKTFQLKLNEEASYVLP
jgi:transcriptional regulator of NAD metabolism